MPQGRLDKTTEKFLCSKIQQQTTIHSILDFQHTHDHIWHVTLHSN